MGERFLHFIAAAMALLVAPVVLHAQFTWTGGGGDNLWSNQLNWNGSVVVSTDPLVLRLSPQSTDNVAFTVNATTGGGQCSTLDVGAGATLQITSSGLTIYDGLNIEGNLSFDGDPGTDTNETITLRSDMVLNDGGDIVLKEEADSVLTGLGNNSFTNINGRIMGQGKIRRLSIINESLIRSEGGVLQVEKTTFDLPADIDNTNGVIEIATGSEFSYTSGTLTGGTISVEDGGVFSIPSGEIASSTLVTAGTGVLKPGRFSSSTNLSDVTLNGSWNISYQDVGSSAILGISSSLVNTGTLSFANESFSEQIRLNSDVTLSGGGEIVLVDAANSIIEEDRNVAVTLTNVDNTIRGRGRILSVDIINQSVIRSEGGVLELSVVPLGSRPNIDNTNGVIEIATGSEFSNGGSGTLTGGTISAEDGGVLSIPSGNITSSTLVAGGTGVLKPGRSNSSTNLSDVTLNGSWNIISQNVDVAAILGISSSLVNTGTLSFANESFSEQIRLNSDVTLSGGGEIVLVDAANSVINKQGSVAVTLTNVDNTILGQGRIQGVDIINHSLVRSEGGRLSLSGLDVTNEGGAIEITDGSTLFGSSFDLLQDSLGLLLIDGVLETSSNFTITGGKIEGGGIIDTSGSLITLSGATLSPGSSPGDLAVESRITFQPDSTYEVELGGTTRGVNYDTIQQIGNLTANGVLSIKFIDGFQGSISNSDSFTIYSLGTGFTDFSTSTPIAGYSGTAGTISGAFLNAPNGSRVSTAEGLGNFLITYTPTEIILSDFQATNPFDVISQQNAQSDGDGDGVELVYEFLFDGSFTAGDLIKTLDPDEAMSGADLMALDGTLILEAASRYPTFDLRIRRDRSGIIVTPVVSMDLSFADSPSVDVRQVGTAVPNGDFDVLRYVVAEQGTNGVPIKAFLRLDIDISALPAF